MVMASRFGSTLPGAIIGPLRFPLGGQPLYLMRSSPHTEQPDSGEPKALMPEGERHDDDPV